LKSKDEIEAASDQKRVQRSFFLPTLNATYQYNRNDEEGRLGGFLGGITTSLLDEYSLVASFEQPIFDGFAILNQYKIADLGLNVAEVNDKLVRLAVIFETKRAYFSVLKAQKLVAVADESVKLIRAQEEVAQNFYDVGMTPLNDLLQTQVELANAKQDLIVATNDLKIAQSQFNTVLRKPINSAVRLNDIQEYVPLKNDIDYYLKYAEEHRLEVQVADLEIEIADKEVTLAKKNYYPTVSLQGQWFRRGTEWDLSDDGDIVGDPEGWSITGIASWDFWEWGRTYYGSHEKLKRLSQAKHTREEVFDQISLEVNEAYLRAVQSEKNILAIEKAITQAEENLRIVKERYKEQVATSTDVLIAQTLLTQTMTNYYNALYDFKIAKAALQRALSYEVLE
jgi:outer membrane protein TolC